MMTHDNDNASNDNVNPSCRCGFPPSAAEIDALGRQALAEIPDAFARYLPDVVFVVEEFAEDDVLTGLELDNPYELCGLYSGVAVGDKPWAGDIPHGPDMIFLYRQPLLAEWCEGDMPLYELVRHVVWHEVGHHFGLTDAGMESLLAEVNPLPDAEDHDGPPAS